MPIPPANHIMSALEQLIRRDPARRGLIGTEPEFGPLCNGHLTKAAAEIAQNAVSVGILTGFFIPQGEPPAAETDGPLGALFLAEVCENLGIEAWIVTDELCSAAVHAAAAATGYPASRIVSFSNVDEHDVAEFYRSPPAEDWTHVVAVERVGPNHTETSFLKQSREAEVPLAEFQQQVPERSRDRCYNMRGEPIDEFSGNLHLFVERLAGLRPDLRTIGIGDGANEIGMGSIAWEDLARRLEGEGTGLIPCRIATDWTIIAGTSNWGGYALAAGVAALRNRSEVLQRLDAAQQMHTLEQMVRLGPAVDGVTRRQEPTVDGLPFATYIQPLDGIRRVLKLS